MVSPLDAAWDVVKGEAFHPSVAGYMAAGHGGERDQAILEEMRRMEEMYGSVPLNEQQVEDFHNRYMELEDSLSDDPHALENMRAARPNAERENRPRSFHNRYGEYDISRPSTDEMPPRRMPSGKRDALRLQMYNAGRGKPVGPTGELDTLAHLSDEPIGTMRTDTQILSDELDLDQEARLPPMGSTVRPEPYLRRSSDSPIDTAWSILKELSREDLEMAARTGGVPRMSGTMRPEFISGHPGHMAPMLGELSQPPAYDEGSEMMQQYNELIHPEEEAEHHRINAPTPARSLGMHGMHGINYDDGRMRLTNEIPIEEAGDASMPDPSQMEHLGAQLAHADMMRDDVNPAAGVPIRIERDDKGSLGFTNLPSHFSRAPNRAALTELGTYLDTTEIMSRIMNGEQVSDEELMYLQNNI